MECDGPLIHPVTNRLQGRAVFCVMIGALLSSRDHVYLSGNLLLWRQPLSLLGESIDGTELTWGLLHWGSSLGRREWVELFRVSLLFSINPSYDVPPVCLGQGLAALPMQEVEFSQRLRCRSLPAHRPLRKDPTGSPGTTFCICHRCWWKHHFSTRKCSTNTCSRLEPQLSLLGTNHVDFVYKSLMFCWTSFKTPFKYMSHHLVLTISLKFTSLWP